VTISVFITIFVASLRPLIWRVAMFKAKLAHVRRDREAVAANKVAV
jgi:hypothetical protein